jgi:magnesium transporter
MSDGDEDWVLSADMLRDYQDPGTPPGTLRPADGESGPSRIVVTSYGPDDSSVQETSDPASFDRLGGDGRVHWIHVIGLADVKVIEQLGASFLLHPLALEDVMTLGQRPKAEDYEDSLFAIFQFLSVTATRLRKTQIALFLGKDFVITFQPGGPDLLAPVRERIVKGRGRLRQKGACYLAYAVVDLVIDSTFPALEELGEELDEVEDAILENPEREDVERLQAVRRELLLLRQVLWAQREVVGRLAREEHDLMPDDVRIYYRDCYDHAVQAMEVSENFREMASGLLDIYLSSLSHRLNEVMRVLTIISTVFMPLSFLAGVYGMNFDTRHPLNMPELGWRYGYVSFWVVAIGMVSVMLWQFRRRGWI